jgi:spore germination protein KA
MVFKLTRNIRSFFWVFTGHISKFGHPWQSSCLKWQLLVLEPGLKSLLNGILPWGQLIIFISSSTFFVVGVTFHPEMIPTPLAVSIAAQREGVPFPALAEALILDLAYEVLREGTVRVPLVFGPAVSILGVLFLGQIAVQAGLVSPFMVIMVSITAIASLASPIFSMGISIRMLRFIFLILGGILGLYGLIWGLAALLIHLAALRSFGVPYAEPLLPLIPSGLADSVVRVPWWSRLKRPSFTAGRNQTRQAAGQRPEPPPPDEDSGSKGGNPK